MLVRLCVLMAPAVLMVRARGWRRAREVVS
jgi:hypothetical protein